MINVFLLNALKDFGDFIGDIIDKGGSLIGGLMDLKVNGSGWGLSTVDLLYQAYRVNRDGLPKMEEIGKNRRRLMSGFDNPWGGAGATPARPHPLVLDLNRDGKVVL